MTAAVQPGAGDGLGVGDGAGDGEGDGLGPGDGLFDGTGEGDDGEPGATSPMLPHPAMSRASARGARDRINMPPRRA